MKQKKYTVQTYYSTFCSHEVVAINKEEAILKARKRKIKTNELLSNIDAWNDADIIEEAI